MLVFTLLFLLLASISYVLIRLRGGGWLAYLMLASISVVAWMCSVGVFALALDNKVASSDDISLMAKALIAGFLLYPFVLWMIAKSFERGRAK